MNEIDRLNGLLVQRGATGMIEQVADDLEKLRQRIAELEKECEAWYFVVSTLSAGACIYDDGRGVTADDGGVLYCRVVQENDRLKVDVEQLARDKNDLMGGKPFAYCSYCDYRITADSVEQLDEALHEHVLHCGKHPVYTLSAQLRSIVEEAQAFKETNILYNIEITQAEIKDFIVKLASLTLPGEENNE